MAITKCVECGGKVSTRATACPHCGAPAVSSTSASPSNKTPTWRWVVVAVLGIPFLIAVLGDTDRPSDSVLAAREARAERQAARAARAADNTANAVAENPPKGGSILHRLTRETDPASERKRDNTSTGTVSSNAIGCADPTVLRQANRYGQQGDQDAYAALLGPKVQSGECAMLTKGDVVFIEDVGLLSGLYCVRPRSATQCFNVEREFVGD